MPTQWNDEEDVAMDYLPHVDQVLYLRGIRRRMNYQTGIAGQEAPISYAWLAQLAEVRSEQGSHAAAITKMSRSALRASFARMERAGLIKRIPTADRGLIFECLLASRGQSVPRRNDPRTTPERPQVNDPIIENKNKKMDEMNDPRATHAAPAMSDPIQGTGIRLLRGAKAPVEPAPGVPDLGDEKPAKGLNGATLPVRTVFEYWRHVMNHPGAILDTKRSRAIAARLKAGYSVDQLKLAIDGCKASPWHQGQNDRHQVYDDIDLICRDAKRVESFIAKVAGVTAQQQELDAWMNEGVFIEGEYRHVKV
jgi:hypothetical protein